MQWSDNIQTEQDSMLVILMILFSKEERSLKWNHIYSLEITYVQFLHIAFKLSKLFTLNLVSCMNSPQRVMQTFQLAATKFNSVCGHQPLNPELVKIDYYLFTYLKKWLASQWFENDELPRDVKELFKTDVFDPGIQNLLPRYQWNK